MAGHVCADEVPVSRGFHVLLLFIKQLFKPPILTRSAKCRYIRLNNASVTVHSPLTGWHTSSNMTPVCGRTSMHIVFSSYLMVVSSVAMIYDWGEQDNIEELFPSSHSISSLVIRTGGKLTSLQELHSESFHRLI